MGDDICHLRRANICAANRQTLLGNDGINTTPIILSSNRSGSMGQSLVTGINATSLGRKCQRFKLCPRCVHTSVLSRIGNNSRGKMREGK
eukprot:7068709-Pyramimonas_sp.AAC.1